MAETKTTTGISAEYIWPDPKMDSLKGLFEGPVRTFLPGGSVQATHTIEGAWRSETTFDSLDTWFPNLTTGVDRVWVAMNDYSVGRGFTLDWQPPGGTLRITAQSPAAKGAEAELQSLRDAFTGGLGLKPPGANRAERLFTPSAGDGAWILPALEFAKDMTGPATRFWGSWDESEVVDHQTRTEADWRSHIDSAQRWSGEWSGRGHRVRVDFQGSRSEVRISIESWDESAIRRALDRSKTLPGLKARIRDGQKQGDFRRYFLSAEATADWYRHAVTLLKNFVGNGSNFWGRVVRKGTSRTERGYGDSAVWRAAVNEAMTAGDIERSYVSYYGPDRSITLDLDHLRDALSADVQSVGGEGVEPMHATLVADLKLETQKDDAYRYHQWGRTYDIKWADSEAFGRRLEAGFQELFPGRRLALTTATLHTGTDDETVSDYDDLHSLAADLGKKQDLSAIHVVAQAPRGEFMAVHVDRNLRRMQLLAFVKFERFQKFANQLKDALKRMEPRESNDADAGAARAGEKKSGWFVQVMPAAVALVVGLVGTKLFDARREPAELTIDQPAARDGAAAVQSHDVTVSWTYKEPRLFARPTIDTDRGAVVEVTRQADQKAVVQGEKHRGSVRLTNLEEGSYVIRVTTEEASKTLVLNVTPAPAQPASKDRPVRRAAPR